MAPIFTTNLQLYEQVRFSITESEIIRYNDIVLNEGIANTIKTFVKDLGAGIAGAAVGAGFGAGASYALISALGLIFPPVFIGLFTLPATIVLTAAFIAATVEKALNLRQDQKNEKYRKSFDKLVLMISNRDEMISNAAKNVSGSDAQKIEKLANQIMSFSNQVQSDVLTAQKAGTIMDSDYKKIEQVIDLAKSGKITFLKKK